MSIYTEVLSECFPYHITLKKQDALLCIKELLRSDDRFNNGTSWAVTSDSLVANSRILWLSGLSWSRLKEKGLVYD